MVIFGDTAFGGRRVMEWSGSSGRVTFESLATRRCVVLLSTVVARREALRSAGLFPAAFHCEDLDLWLRMALRGTEMAYTHAPLARRREHAAAASADGARLRDGRVRVLQPYLLDERLTAAQRAAVAIGLGQMGVESGADAFKQHLRHGRLSEASEALADLLSVRPSLKLRSVQRALRALPGLAALALRVAMRARRRSSGERAVGPAPVERLVRDHSRLGGGARPADLPEQLGVPPILPPPSPPAPRAHPHGP